MELAQWQLQSIHGLAIHSPESNKSSRWSLMELAQWQLQSIHGLAIQSWIQQKQPVEFDGFGTHGYVLYSLGYTVEYWIIAVVYVVIIVYYI